MVGSADRWCLTWYHGRWVATSKVSFIYPDPQLHVLEMWLLAIKITHSHSCLSKWGWHGDMWDKIFSFPHFSLPNNFRCVKIRWNLTKSVRKWLSRKAKIFFSIPSLPPPKRDSCWCCHYSYRKCGNLTISLLLFIFAGLKVITVFNLLPNKAKKKNFVSASLRSKP